MRYLGSTWSKNPKLARFGPTNFAGWSYRFAVVRLFVRLFRVFLKTGYRIFPKIVMKLKDNNRKKLTQPDFTENIWIIQ